MVTVVLDNGNGTIAFPKGTSTHFDEGFLIVTNSTFGTEGLVKASAVLNVFYGQELDNHNSKAGERAASGIADLAAQLNRDFTAKVEEAIDEAAIYMSQKPVVIDPRCQAPFRTPYRPDTTQDTIGNMKRLCSILKAELDDLLAGLGGGRIAKNAFNGEVSFKGEPNFPSFDPYHSRK